MNRSIHTGNNGMTLPGVLIALGLVSTLALATAQIGVMGTKSSASQKFKLDANLFHQNIFMLLSDKDVCKKALRHNGEYALYAAEHNIDNINRIRFGGIDFAREGHVYGNLEVQNIKMVEKSPAMRTFEGTAQRYFVDLEIRIRLPETTMGATEQTLKIPLFVFTDHDSTNSIPDYRVIECFAGAADIIDQSVVVNTPISEPSVYVHRLINREETAGMSNCANGYAVQGIWDGNDEFKHYDLMKCRKLLDGLWHHGVMEILGPLNPMGGGSFQPHETWNVECSGHKVIIGFNDDNDNYSDIDRVQCAELRNNEKRAEIKDDSCVVLGPMNPMDGGVSNAVMDWNVQCPPNTLMRGIWDDGDFSDTDYIKCCTVEWIDIGS